MSLFLLNQFGSQEIVDLPSKAHIHGEILWDESMHGPLPADTVAGAMNLIVEEEVYDDPSGAVDWIPDPNPPPPEVVVPPEGELPLPVEGELPPPESELAPPIEAPVLIQVPRKLKREISRRLEVDVIKLAEVNQKRADKKAKKDAKAVRDVDLQALVAKLKNNENLSLKEVSDYLRLTIP